MGEAGLSREAVRSVLRFAGLLFPSVLLKGLWLEPEGRAGVCVALGLLRGAVFMLSESPQTQEAAGGPILPFPMGWGPGFCAG